MTRLQDLPDVLRAQQVADLLDVGKNLVYEQAKAGAIPGAVYLGSALRFSKPAIARWLGFDGATVDDERDGEAA